MNTWTELSIASQHGIEARCRQHRIRHAVVNALWAFAACTALALWAWALMLVH